MSLTLEQRVERIERIFKVKKSAQKKTKPKQEDIKEFSKLLKVKTRK